MRKNKISIRDPYNERRTVRGRRWAVRLRDLREDHDLTQAALAASLHLRQNTYSQYENVQRQIPLDVLIQLAAYYQTSVDYLLGLTDVPAPYPRRNRNR